MTPDEKKASEVVSKIPTDFDLGGYLPTVEMISEALDEAERRGFERAKRMAVELCESLGNTSYSKETRVQIFENLKYEEA